MSTILDADKSTSSNGAAVEQSNNSGKGRTSFSWHEAHFWRNPCPASIRKQVAKDPAVWTSYLAKRGLPESVRSIFQGSRSPLCWGIDVDSLSENCCDLVRAAEGLSRPTDQTSRRKSNASSARSAANLNALIADWKNEAAALAPNVSNAYSSLAVAHLLLNNADRIDPVLWWQAMEELWEIVQLFDQWQLQPECSPDHALAQQLLAGELPLTLACLLPEIKPLKDLKASARERLSEAIIELLNGEGLLSGQFVSVMPALLACWTRCKTVGVESKKGAWSAAADAQYGWLVRQALRWTSASGRFLLSDAMCSAWTNDFLSTALKLGGDDSDWVAAKPLLTNSAAGPRSSATPGFDPPDASDHCAWAKLALMRTSWGRDAIVVGVNYSDIEMQLNVVSRKTELLRGAWQFQTSLEETALRTAGKWEEICWFSDDDVDFLELSIDLAGGAQLDRQIVLAKRERFLLLADYIVSGDQHGSLQHNFALPLPANCRFAPELETREGMLVDKKSVARVLPLALREWRSDPRGGELESLEGGLTLERRHVGTAIACPLFIDLDARRASKQCTWRQLTVAQKLEIQPPDVAVGYRVQCGKRQWLIYRSLAEKANRTVLGQNTSSDCLIARFNAPAGDIEQIVEIEG